jgi:hypothetical protein
MIVMAGSTRARQAFEQLGQIREHLTALQDIAADLEDPSLSMSVRNAMSVNTNALYRVNEILQSLKATDPADEDLDSQHAGGARRS